MTRQISHRHERSSGGPNKISKLSAVASRWRIIAVSALIPAAALAMSGLLSPSSADPGGLAGSWRGSGWVTFSSGKKERARCRAQYSPASAKSYTLKASCATSSAKATQRATVTEISKNRYRGSFYNTEYNASGTVRIVLRGRTQSVTLSGDAATATIQMRR